MQKISARVITDRIYRDFKPSDSTWFGDAWDMIGEAIEGIGYHVAFDKVEDIYNVTSGNVKWTRKYTDINFIEYKGLNLPLGGDKTSGGIAGSEQPTVTIDPYRLNRMNELITQWDNLEEMKAGASPEDVIIYTAKQAEISKEISKLASELAVKLNTNTIIGQYYQLLDDYILTSFPEGEIKVYGTAFPVDQNNIPMIIDTYKYRNACFFKVASLLCLQGYKHPELDYDKADAKWEDFRHQASNEPRIMDAAKHERFAKLWTRYKTDPYEASTFFKNIEQ